MILPDHEFLTDARPINEKHLIYFVRDGLLKGEIKSRFVRAFSREHLVERFVSAEGLSMSLQAQFFENEISVCEVNTKSEAEELETSLFLIATEDGVGPCCILVKADNRLRSLPYWPQVVRKCVVLQEAYVSRSNVEKVFRFLVHWQNLQGFSDAEYETALALLSASAKAHLLSLREAAGQLDLLLLSPTFAAECMRRRRERGDVLNECLMNFLVEPMPHTMRKLLRIVDAMKWERLEGSPSIVSGLYRFTEKILLGGDKRYGHNKPGSVQPVHFLVWAVLLLGRERDLLSEEIVEGFERLCREYMATDAEALLEDPTSFKGAFYPCLIPDSPLAARRESLVRAVGDLSERLGHVPNGAPVAITRLAFLKDPSIAGRQDEWLR